MKLIIHAGTGTIIDLDDDVFYLDTNDLSVDQKKAILEDDSNEEIVNLASEKGRRLTSDALEITPANSMIFTPMSIKYEVEMTEAFVSDDIAEWVLNKATEADLWEISNAAISDDLLWRNFSDVLGGAIEGVYKRKVKS